MFVLASLSGDTFSILKSLPGWAGELLWLGVTPWPCSAQKFLLVSFTSLLFLILKTDKEHLPAPPDGPYPSDQVHSSHHLKRSDEELSLAPRCSVASTCCENRSTSRQDDAENEDDVGPGSV